APAQPARAERAPAPAARPKTASFLAGDLTFTGTLSGDGDVHLGGPFEGEVRAQNVTVGAGGRVDGTVKGRRIEVLGQVKGALIADEVRVRLNAQVEGDVTSDSFTLEAGARFEGMSRRKPA
ncbi:polymer-forming cytoskeletal protein, partial [Caulobacter sp. 17J65-9]|uniref:bactofilin family protein n=1 Tax=Caulobacter sp. 17J65-9 TaxID=2709382 RepID=UPI0013C68F15